MTWYHVAVWIGNSIVLLNIILLFVSGKKLAKPLWVLQAFLIGVLGIQIALAVLANLGKPNQHLSHYYVVGQFALLSMFYYCVVRHFKWIIISGLTLFTIFIIIQLLSGKIVYTEFNTPVYLVSSCIIMTYTMVYFAEHIKKKYFLDLFNIGLFMYFGGSSILFFTMNRWKDFEEWNYSIWLLNALLFALFQLSITGSIRAYRRRVEK